MNPNPTWPHPPPQPALPLPADPRSDVGLGLVSGCSRAAHAACRACHGAPQTRSHAWPGPWTISCQSNQPIFQRSKSIQRLSPQTNPLKQINDSQPACENQGHPPCARLPLLEQGPHQTLLRILRELCGFFWLGPDALHVSTQNKTWVCF